MTKEMTDGAIRCLGLAEYEARRFNHAFVNCEHLLIGLASEGSGVAAHVLETLGADHRSLRTLLAEGMGCGDPLATGGPIAKSRHLDVIIERAAMEAEIYDDDFIGTEHLLLALVAYTGLAVSMLACLEITPQAVRNEVLRVIEAQKKGAPAPTSPVPGELTLRDYFAANALGGLLSKVDCEAAIAAGHAYRYADAMLKARRAAGQ